MLGRLASDVIAAWGLGKMPSSDRRDADALIAANGDLGQTAHSALL
jgi:hypothetical protein